MKKIVSARRMNYVLSVQSRIYKAATQWLLTFVCSVCMHYGIQFSFDQSKKTVQFTSLLNVSIR